MQQSKFIILLRQLNSRELTRFEEFVDSPFFNKHKEVTFLCHYILKFAPDFDHEFLDKSYLFKKVYPHKQYNRSKLHSLFSQALNLLQEYLVETQYKKDIFKREVYLLEQLNHRKTVKHFQAVSRKYEQLKHNQKTISASNYLNDFLYQQQLDQFFLSKDSRSFDQHLQLKSDNLDRYFLIEKLKIACDMVSRSNVVKGEYYCYMLDKLLEYLNENEKRFETNPILQIYRTIYKTLEDSNNEDHYLHLKELLKNTQSTLDNEELNEMYGYALNYCVKQINKGRTDYYNEVYDLYLFLIENKIIFQDGFLLESDYKNVVTACVRLNKLDQTKQFIQTYQNALHPKVRENAYAYNMASYYYAAKQYKSALQMLFDVEFTETAYHLGAKIIQLKSYYELDETEALHSLIEAFKIYVKRSNQFSEYWKSSNFNLIKLTKRTYSLKQKKKFISGKAYQQKLAELKQLLASTSPISNQNWLERTINQLDTY